MIGRKLKRVKTLKWIALPVNLNKEHFKSKEIYFQLESVITVTFRGMKEDLLIIYYIFYVSVLLSVHLLNWSRTLIINYV